MRPICDRRRNRAATPAGFAAVLAIGVAVMLLAAPTIGAARPKAKRPVPEVAPQPAAAPDTFVVRDTPTNLQAVFTNELNAKQRYEAFATQADLEHQPGVASLFRACAKAEEVHAHRHAEAIALTGEQARALLERLTVGTTAENLQVAVANETYEADHLYPAVLARARADHATMAVRSMNYALGAEREHAQLFRAALAGLARPAPAATFYVCPTCGKTITHVGFHHCPNCFTSARKFIRVT